METEMEAVQESDELKIPDLLPLLPVRDVVVYPYMILPLFVGREASINAVDKALSGDRLFFWQPRRTSARKTLLLTQSIRSEL